MCQAAISLGEPSRGFDPGISEWGNPVKRELNYLIWSERGELKHLSTLRKRNQKRLR